MARLATQQTSSLPSTPYTGRRGSASSSEGWWEHVLPQGRLAERLRKAHEPGQPSFSHGIRPSVSDRSQIRGVGALSFNSSSSSSSSSSGRQPTSSPRIPFPSGNSGEVGTSKIDSHPPTGSITSVRTNLDKGRTSQRIKGCYEPADIFDGTSDSGKGKAALRGTGHISPRGDGSTSNAWRRQTSHTSYNTRLFPPLASFGSRSSLSSTPEVSSGSENEAVVSLDSASRRRTRSALPFSATGIAATPLPPSSGSISTRATKLSFHSSLSRGTGKASSRRVNFELDADEFTKSEEEEPRNRHTSTLQRGSFEASHGGFSNAPNTYDYPPWHSMGPSTMSTSRSSESIHYRLPSAADTLAASGAQHWFNSTSSATMSRRRTRTLSRDGFGTHFSSSTRLPGSTIRSAATSPRTSIHLSEADGQRLRETLAARRTGGVGRVPNSSPPSSIPTQVDHQHLPLSRSFQKAQSQLLRTTSNAIGFSRSILAVPGPVLRPLFHFTLIWCVSGATVMALVSFLVMSYCLTVWDDVGVKGKAVRIRNRSARDKGNAWNEVVDSSSSTTSTTSSGDGTPTSSSSSSSSSGNTSETNSSSPPTTSSSRRSSTTMETTRLVLDHLFLHPLTYAASVPMAVAKSLTPSMVEPGTSRQPSVNEMSSASTSSPSEQVKEHQPSSHAKKGPSSSSSSSSSTPNGRPSSSSSSSTFSSSPSSAPPLNLPPRPPLTSLIPSMLFTILIAVGAGLVGGWAKKYSKPREYEYEHDGASNVVVQQVGVRVSGRECQEGEGEDEDLRGREEEEGDDSAEYGYESEGYTIQRRGEERWLNPP